MPPTLPTDLIHPLVAFVGVLTPDGTLIEVNEPALVAVGLAKGDVVGRKLWDCYWWSHDPAEQDRLRDAVARARGGETVRYEAVVRMAEDERITIDFRLAPLRAEKGRITLLIPSATDITDRIAAERELRQSRDAAFDQVEQLETIYESAPIALWVFDCELRFRQANPRFTEMVGVPMNDLLGRTLMECFPGVPEASALVRSVLETGQPVVKATVSGSLSTESDGENRTWEVSYAPLRNVRGEVTGVSGIGREITADLKTRRALEQAVREAERRRAEVESLHAVSPAGLCFHDADLVVRYANARLEEINGIPNDQLLGRSPADLDPALGGQVVPLLERVMHTGDPVVNHQLTWAPPHDPDHPRHFLVNFAAVREHDGRQVRGVMAAVVDITEIVESRRQLETWTSRLEAEVSRRTQEVIEQNRRLAEMRREVLDAQNRERRRLAKILHDELQQTLAAARIDADVLAMRDSPPDEVAASLQCLLAEAGETARNLSHELYPSVLATDGLGAALRWKAHLCSERYGLDVRCDVQDPVGLSAQMQAFLYDVARELLFNVHKHACTDHAELTLTCTPAEVSLRVSDQGNGCDETRLSETGGHRGDSMGLPLIRHRLKLLGGRMRVRGAPQGGCEVEVTLPVPPGEGQNGDRPPVAPNTSPVT